MKPRGGHIIYCIFTACLLFFANSLQADEDDLSTKKVYLDKNKGSIYELLQQITDQTGYFFTYDSQLINNNKAVKINKGEYRLLDAIRTITGNRKLEAKLIDKHLLLYIPKQEEVTRKETKKSYYTVNGTLYDAISKEPIQYGFVNISGTNISTTTNHNGDFRLTVPDSLTHIAVKSSFLGYSSKELEASITTNKRLNFALDPQYTPLQEAVVRVVNPTLQIQKILENRSKNYASKPAYITTFYREIIEHKRSMTITESVIDLYKSGYYEQVYDDYAKLIKKRAIMAKNQQDSILVKMKAGVMGTLMLDIMKDIPGFLMLDERDVPYTFLYAGMTSIDDRDINIISFEQKQEVIEPLYKGLLYIDAENYALVEAQFEVNPTYIASASTNYVIKQPKTHKVSLQRAAYTVSYKPNSNRVYYLNQVRGDLDFRIRKRKSIFSSLFKISFELIVCDIKTENVKPFPKEERLQTHKVFSETKHPYDIDFWESFNIILPENEVRKFMLNNLIEVAETLPENNP